MINKYLNMPHYCHHTQCFFNTPSTQPIQGGLGTIIPIFWNMFINKKTNMPQKLLPTIQPNWEYFFQNNQRCKIIWFGHSTWLIYIAGKTLLFDPVFAKSVSPIPIFMQRFQKPVIDLIDLPNIDYIIYSHNHYDHLDKHVVEYFKKSTTRFIVPLKMGDILQQWGISSHRITELDWWQNIQEHDLILTAVPARHHSARGYFDKDKSLWAGFVLQTSQEKIYYSGDSAYGDGWHFKQIGEYFKGFDLALIENGQFHPAWFDNHLLPTQTVQAVHDVQAKCFMPVHWGAYALSTHHWSEPVQQTTEILQGQGIGLLTPLQGQVVQIDSVTERWWQVL